jgi:hypothetical protein
MPRELCVFKIIIIYAIFIEFIDNTKLEEVDGADDNVCTSCMLRDVVSILVVG